MNFQFFRFFLKDFLSKYNFYVGFQINEFSSSENITKIKMYLTTNRDKEKMLYDISEKLHQECCIRFNMIYMSFTIRRPGLAEIEIK